MKSDDTLWSGYNEQIESLSKAKQWFGLGTLYYQMAEVAKNEGIANQYLKDLGIKFKAMARADDIDGYKKNGSTTKVELVANPKACEVCIAIAGIEIELTDMNALLKSIYRCTNSQGCRCATAPVIY